jgi:hypothetical protein
MLARLAISLLLGYGLLAEWGANNMLQSGLEKEFEIQLHTGNPGAEGKNNVATENAKKKAAKWHLLFRKVHNNEAAAEWVGVKAKETYKFFSLWWEGKFVGYGEMTEPIAVEIGDTFKFPINSLEIEALEV